MVHRSKQGLIFPEEAFDKLRPYREALLAMSQTYRAGGPEYMALSRAVIALDEAAGVVMSKPGFFLSPWHKT
jgi:hypothetical protein